MKINLNAILLFFLIISVRPAVAQIVVDAGPVDLFDLDNGKFYYKSDDTYDLLEIMFKLNNEKADGYEWEVDYRETWEENPETTFPIYTKNIKKTEPKEFEKLFDGKKYIVYKDKNTRIELMKLNKDHFAICKYQFEEDSRDESDRPKLIWKLFDVNRSAYYYMKLGDKYIIKLLDEDPEYIVPHGNELVALTRSGYNDQKIRNLKPEKLTDKDKETLLANINIGEKLNYKIKRTDEGYTLLNKFNARVLPQTYDSIQIGTQHIITEKNGRATVFNTFLDTIVVNNLQAAYLNIHTFSPNIVEGIANNEHIWIVGQNLKKDATIIPWERDLIPPGLSLLGYQLIKDKDDYQLIRFANQDITKLTIKNVSIDKLYFIGKDSIWGGADFEDYSELITEGLIVEKDGKYGLSTIIVNKDNKTFSLKERVPVIFDNIEAYPSHKGGEHLLYKDNLIGFYPKTTEARYLRLDKHKTGNFIRFTLPSGQKGWLNAEDGREYLDIEK